MRAQNEGGKEAVKPGTKALASLGLILTTMIWGSSFVVMKTSVDVIPPSYLLAVRFTLAGALLFLAAWKNIRAAGKRGLVCGAVLGLFLEIAYLFQTYGLKYTTASKNAFITTLYVIIVPFLHWLFWKKRPRGQNLAAALLAVAGLALLSLQGDLTMNFGDFLTLLSGIAFALQMVFIDRFTEEVEPVVLATVQIVVAAALSWVLAPALDGAFAFSVLAEPSLFGGIFYLALFPTLVGFLLQNIGQKYLSAATSAILLSLESLFGALFSVVFLKEVLTGRMLLGCALMFAAVILSELKPGKQ